MGLVSARKRGKFWQYRFEAASVKSVQARLGHQNVTTTLQTYVHDTPATEADAVSIFERHGVGLGHTLRRRGQFVVSGHVFTSFSFENLCKSGKVKRQSRCAPYMEIALGIGAFRGQTVRNCRSFCGYAVLYFTRLYCLKVAKPWTAPTILL